MNAGWGMRAYERLGTRYIPAVAALVVGLILILVIGFPMILGARFEGLSVAEFVKAYAIVAACGTVAMGILIAQQRMAVRPVNRWIGGERVDGAEVVAIVQALPRRLAVRGAVYVALTQSIAGPLTLLSPNDRVALWAWFVYAVGTLISEIGGLLVAWMILEVALRPVLVDAARAAPEANRIQIEPLPIQVRLLTVLAVISFAAVLMGAAFTEPYDSGVDRLARLYVIALGPLLICAPFIIITANIVGDPIRRLTEATREVGAGRLDVEVPVVTADELGALAESFNEMVEGLRERDALRGRVVAVADESRRRIERDLHDGAQQNLVLMRLQLSVLERRFADDPAAATAMRELRDQLDTALAELRDLAHGIYPAVLESDGLQAALCNAAARASLPVHVEPDGTGRYAPELEAAVYFCCLEALQNAAKHAGEGASVRVSLAESDGWLRFSVADDGAGLDGADQAVGSGLQNMRDRMVALGGSLEIDSAPGAGTTVSGTVPVGELS